MSRFEELTPKREIGYLVENALRNKNKMAKVAALTIEFFLQNHAFIATFLLLQLFIQLSFNSHRVQKKSMSHTDTCCDFFDKSWNPVSKTLIQKKMPPKQHFPSTGWTLLKKTGIMIYKMDFRGQHFEIRFGWYSNSERQRICVCSIPTACDER